MTGNTTDLQGTPGEEGKAGENWVVFWFDK